MSDYYPQLFEEANSNLPSLSKSAPNKTMLNILASDPAFKDEKGRQRYSYTGNGYKIKNDFRIIVEPAFLADVDKAFKILEETYNLKITNIEGPNIVEPSTPGKFKNHYSSEYKAYEYEITAEYQDKKGNIVEKELNSITLIPTQPKGEKSTKTPTEVKEGLVNYFFSSDKEFEPFTTSQRKEAKKEESYIEKISEIIQEIENGNGIPGINVNDNKIIIRYLRMEKKYNVKLVHTFNNAMSIGNWLRNSNFSNWEIRRDDFFNNLKMKIGYNLGFPRKEIDKWNPMDIMMIRPGSEDEIKERIEIALTEENEDLKLGKINSLFVDEIDSKNDEALICAISLKEEMAQAGKATGYFRKPQNPKDTIELSKENIEKNLEKEEDTYKLTKKENTWPKEKFLHEIITKREEIQKILSIRLDEFTYRVGDIKSFNPAKNHFSKYAALKLLNHILVLAEEENNIFTNIVRYGLSLSKNPTFFKFIGNKEGDSSKVEKKIEAYPPNAGLQLYNKRTGDFDGKILILDGNENSGIDIRYAIEFAGKIYDAKLSIRSNQGTHPGIQVVVEIQRWSKNKDLNEIFYPPLF